MRPTPPVVTERAIVAPIQAITAEEHALRSSAIVLERDDRRRWSIAGPNAADVLNGLVTNDVSKLTPGSGQYAAALTPKGKVIADLRILAREEDFLVDAAGPAASGWDNVLRKYVNPRLAKYSEITAQSADVAIAGPRAANVIAATLGIDSVALERLPPHSHLPLALAGAAHTVVRAAELEVPAFDLIVAADERARIYGLLTEAGAVPASSATWEGARIAHGWPVWGKDMDETTLAQEASLDARGAISFDKGCYTGQETVARVHFRGHVNRFLRRARFAAAAAIPRGANLLDDSGKIVGDVRSSTITAEGGGVAIVMVRREITDGTTLTAGWNDRTEPISLLADGGANETEKRS
jgi:folate-binding protein YgfZ